MAKGKATKNVRSGYRDVTLRICAADKISFMNHILLLHVGGFESKSSIILEEISRSILNGWTDDANRALKQYNSLLQNYQLDLKNLASSIDDHMNEKGEKK
jgi:hypothetical protein